MALVRKMHSVVACIYIEVMVGESEIVRIVRVSCQGDYGVLGRRGATVRFRYGVVGG